MSLKKLFAIGMVFGLILLGVYLFTLADGKLHVVFCNVGQGDGSYIRAPNGQDMVIDGGPDNRILLCLGKYMPFHDRTIDVVVLTHPQKDHMQGLLSILDRYTVKYFIIGMDGNDTIGYKQIVKKLTDQKIPTKNLFSGDSFRLGEIQFTVLWPERQWAMSHVEIAQSPPKETNGAILGLSTKNDLNDFSYYLNLSYGSFTTLFTGDGDSTVQPDILSMGVLNPVTLLKVPHHGSKTGMLAEFLDVIVPRLAVISVGRNSYGHPTKEALELLKNRSIDIKRTDEEGDIEVVSDGSTWYVKDRH